MRLLTKLHELAQALELRVKLLLARLDLVIVIGWTIWLLVLVYEQGIDQTFVQIGSSHNDSILLS